MKEVDVQCITKPLSRKKLLQTLVSNQAPTLIAPAIETHSEEKLPLTVMAVDDNPANLKLITALLKERVETVISCTSGQQAIDKATETPFDIIFMDIQMPQMDG
ncbi:response regulator, partial [Vibrio sp. 10N.222.48.A8]